MLRIVPILAAFAGLGAVGWAWIPKHTAPPNAVDLVTGMGLTAESLAAAGLDQGTARILLGNLGEATDAQVALFSAERELDSLIQQSGALDAALDEDPDDQELVLQRVDQQRHFEEHTALVASRRTTLLENGLRGLSPSSQQGLRTMRQSGGFRIPVVMRAAPAPAGDRENLQAALTAEQRAVIDETPLSSGAVALLSDFRAKSEVVVASQGVMANGAAVANLVRDWRGPE